MIRFLAEIFLQIDTLIHPTPSNDIKRENDIYYLDINRHPRNTYWTRWGGYYDNFTGTNIVLFFRVFLIRVLTLERLLNSVHPALFIDSDLIVRIKLPKHPWLYPDYATQAGFFTRFLSAALDPCNPSRNVFKMFNILEKIPVRLEIPSLSVRLSDNISGISLNQSFNLSLINNDGFFDDAQKWNLFNTPAYLKKAIINNPKYEDFKTIRNGHVDWQAVSFEKLSIKVSDRLRSMSDPVCNIIDEGTFPGIVIDADSRAIGKTVPVVYGRVTVGLQKLNDTTYLAAAHIGIVHGVFDRNGNRIAFRVENNLIIIERQEPDNEDDVIIGDPDTADITGYRENRIGEIIRHLTTEKAGIQFDASNWNIPEASAYITTSPRINIMIRDGDVRGSIQRTLESDMAFMIQQADGRFTLRRYGVTYNKREIPSWKITGKPEKTWQPASEKFFSSCTINYNFRGDSYKSYLYTGRERRAVRLYRRLVHKTFDTALESLADAQRLAELLSDRYATIKAVLTLPVGVDVSGFELLDTVSVKMKINEREFSKAQDFIITAINPAQDVLTLEELL